MRSKIARLGKGAVALLSLPLLSACVTMNPQPTAIGGSAPRSDGFLTVSVAPGRSGACSGTPCRIYYKTPALGQDVNIEANGFKVGSFPPDTVVDLGDYSHTRVRITVPGTDTPAAYVNMPNDSR